MTTPDEKKMPKKFLQMTLFIFGQSIFAVYIDKKGPSGI
jgi:hypothetical protein